MPRAMLDTTLAMMGVQAGVAYPSRSGLACANGGENPAMPACEIIYAKQYVCESKGAVSEPHTTAVVIVGTH